MADLTSTPASSSSSSTNNGQVYDVFLNHRGPDTKKGLASHIYFRLLDRGLRVFLDQLELRKGEDIRSQINEAIRTASVHVAIFSPTYAQSSWCLDELALMVESGSTIFPVFHKVDPSELRRTRSGDGGLAGGQIILPNLEGEKGSFARDLQLLENKKTLDPRTNKEKPRYDSSTLEKWRHALYLVSHKSGFDMKAYCGDEGRLVDAVVEEVCRKARKTAPSERLTREQLAPSQQLRPPSRQLREQLAPSLHEQLAEQLALSRQLAPSLFEQLAPSLHEQLAKQLAPSLHERLAPSRQLAPSQQLRPPSRQLREQLAPSLQEQFAEQLASLQLAPSLQEQFAERLAPSRQLAPSMRQQLPLEKKSIRQQLAEQSAPSQQLAEHSEQLAPSMRQQLSLKKKSIRQQLAEQSAPSQQFAEQSAPSQQLAPSMRQQFLPEKKSIRQQFAEQSAPSQRLADS